MPTGSRVSRVQEWIFRAHETEFSLLSVKPQRADAFVQVGPLHPQYAGRARDVPPGFLQRLEDVLALSRFAGLAQISLGAGAPGDTDLHRHRLAVDLITASQNRHALHGIAQLADVAGPAVIVEGVEHARGQPFGLEVVAGAKLAQEVLGQRSDILAALAQARHAHRHY